MMPLLCEELLDKWGYLVLHERFKSILVVLQFFFILNFLKEHREELFMCVCVL